MLRIAEIALLVRLDKGVLSNLQLFFAECRCNKKIKQMLKNTELVVHGKVLSRIFAYTVL